MSHAFVLVHVHIHVHVGVSRDCIEVDPVGQSRAGRAFFSRSSQKPVSHFQSTCVLVNGYANTPYIGSIVPLYDILNLTV